MTQAIIEKFVEHTIRLYEGDLPLGKTGRDRFNLGVAIGGQAMGRHIRDGKALFV